MTSGGNNFNDFPENQLTKSRAVYTIKANRGPTQDSSIRWKSMIICYSQKDGLNWRLFTATRSFIKPKSGCVTFQACLQCLFNI